MRNAFRTFGTSLLVVFVAMLLLTSAHADDAVAPLPAPAGAAPADPPPPRLVVDPFEAVLPEEEQPSLDPADVMDRFDDIPVEEFGSIVVTATGVRTPELDVPRAMNVVTQERIRRRGVTSAADLLDRPVGRLDREADLPRLRSRHSRPQRLQPAGARRREHPVDVLGRGRVRRRRHVREDRPPVDRADRGRARAVLGALRLERPRRRHQLHHEGVALRLP